MASYPVCSKCSNHEDNTLQVLYSDEDDTLVVRCLRCTFSWICPPYEVALGLRKNRDNDIPDLPKIVTGGGNA